MKSDPNVPALLIFIISVFISTVICLLSGIAVRRRLYRNVISVFVIIILSATCRISDKIDTIKNRSPIVTPNILDIVSDVLIKGATLNKHPPKKKNSTPQIDLSPKRSLCFMSTLLLSTVIFKLAWVAISKMSLLIVFISFYCLREALQTCCLWPGLSDVVAFKFI
ncbi:hypothetical protein SAMN04488055_3154 [Chitinophaga niabensis]|uniref:Uncharacterized protein n=1 Tax=Chitinophaga niabensis TaxID=536979 RepID=A0A1N6H3M0_9BACT|nr:hypothetical protein SAMN04488055_3154 [Chitinophaga niabensis]